MQTLKYQLYMVTNIKLLIYYSLKGLNIKKKTSFIRAVVTKMIDIRLSYFFTNTLF